MSSPCRYILLLLTLPWHSLRAEERLIDLPLETLMDMTIDITTASRYQEKSSDTPSTVIVVTKQQIQERGYLNLSQVLQDLPNIDIQRYASQLTSDQYSIRGIAKNNGFLILQDGIRINSPTGEPIPVNDNFPIHYAKQIEVVYGPASVMYGADALTAVINIITDQAEDINGVETKGVVGEYNSYSHYVKAGKQLGENVAIIAGGHYKESDNPDLGGDYPNDFALHDLVTFGGQTVTPAGDRTGYRGESSSHSAYAKLTLYKDLDIGINYSMFKGRSDIGSRPDYADYGADAYINTGLGTAYANYRLHISDKLSGFIRANYSWYELTPDSRFSNIYNDFTRSGGYKYASGERKQLEAQLQYQIHPAHTLSAGISLEDYYAIPKTVDLDHPYNPDREPNAQNAFYAGTNDALPVKMQYFGYENIGTYLQWSANWTSMLSTTAAIRYDGNSIYPNTVNPKLGLVFKPVDKVVAKLLYGTAFLAPSPMFSREHYGSFSGQQNAQGQYSGDFFNIPNPALKPETIDTVEFNTDYQITDQLTLGVSAYANWLDGIISPTLTPTPVSHYIPGGFIATTQHNDNIGNSIAYGGDLHFNYQKQFSGSVLKLWGNYSHADGALSRSDSGFSTGLPDVAAHKVKLGLTYTLQDKYTITPKLYWIGATNSWQTQANDPAELQNVPSYVRLDLYLSAKVMKNLSLFLNVSNLLDQRYYNTGDRYDSSLVYSPQDPRIVSGGFIYQFGD
ncbi:MAG: TonB-dependent receptor [Methylococcaceae bacterium]|nr:MAG: TonB-dependent receptor [Methylococcaceae bacterium]